MKKSTCHFITFFLRTSQKSQTTEVPQIAAKQSGRLYSVNVEISTSLSSSELVESSDFKTVSSTTLLIPYSVSSTCLFNLSFFDDYKDTALVFCNHTLFPSLQSIQFHCCSIFFNFYHKGIMLFHWNLVLPPYLT